MNRVGPIIVVQIRNEYGGFGLDTYTNYLARMMTSLGIGRLIAVTLAMRKDCMWATVECFQDNEERRAGKRCTYNTAIGMVFPYVNYRIDLNVLTRYHKTY